jgi:hypothetical protein
MPRLLSNALQAKKVQVAVQPGAKPSLGARSIDWAIDRLFSRTSAKEYDS